MGEGECGVQTQCDGRNLQGRHWLTSKDEDGRGDGQQAERRVKSGAWRRFAADRDPQRHGALHGQDERGPLRQMELRDKACGRPGRGTRQAPGERREGGCREQHHGEQDARGLGHRVQYTWRCMRALDIIRAKRDGRALTREEIDTFVRGVTDRSWPDYQVAALLMAIVLRGMTLDEASDLTQAMVDSGDRLDWTGLMASRPGEVAVDKHSTGGVGDKTSLILAPLAVACGAIVPMMSGRGLGHTGGTLDKLAAIPGFRTDLSIAETRRALADVGCALIRQTDDVAPADRTLYALRDATATVESRPLIAASILSKKIAEGIGALVLDVKVGSGGFMEKLDDARELARWLVGIATRSGVRTEALLTRMDTPLGRQVGNANEVRESIATLKGEGPADLESLSVHLAARMLVMAGVAPAGEAESRVREVLRNGRGLETFAAIIAAQGGDARVIDDSGLLAMADREAVVTAPRAGYVSRIHAGAVGHAAVVLGAGRDHVEAVIDPGVGIEIVAPEGTQVSGGDAVLRVTYRDTARLEAAMERLRTAVEITDEAPEPRPLILETIDALERP